MPDEEPIKSLREDQAVLDELRRFKCHYGAQFVGGNLSLAPSAASSSTTVFELRRRSTNRALQALASTTGPSGNRLDGKHRREEPAASPDRGYAPGELTPPSFG